MATKVPDNYKENEVDQLYYGPMAPPEKSFTTDLMRIYSDIEQGGISAGSYLRDIFKYLTDDEEDIPLTQEERNERNMKIQQSLITAKKSGAGGLLPALLGYLQEKNKTDIFEPSGDVRSVETPAGMVAQIGSYIAGGAGAYKLIPKTVPLLARGLIGEQAVEQVMMPSGDANIANIVYDVLPEETKQESIGEFTSFLAANPEDTESTQRLKSSVLALGISTALLGVGKATVGTVKGGIAGTALGIEALKNLRSSNNLYKKPVEELTEDQQADVVVEYFSLAREQAAKERIDTARASNIRGEGVGTPTGKPRPSRVDYEEGPEGDKKFKAALTRWRNQDTPRDPTLPTEEEILTETAEGITQVERQNASMFRRFKQKFFTTRGYFTPKAQTLFEDSRNAQRAAVAEAGAIGNRIKKAIDKVGELTAQGATPLGKTSEKILEDVKRAFEFNGTKDLYELPRSERIEFYRTSFGLTEELATEIYKARELIDDYSRRIFNSGVISNEQKVILDSNIGSYFRRSYRAWEDPGFMPDPALKPAAIEETYEELLKEPTIAIPLAKIRETDPDGTKVEEYLEGIRKQAEKQVDNQLEFIQDRELVDFLGQVRGAPNLHQRKEIGPAVRELLGEIKDPIENIILTVNKSSRIYEQNNYYTRIAKLGRSGGWIGDKDISAGRTVRIEGTNNFSLDGFDNDAAAKAAGLSSAAMSWTYTTPEIARAINNKEVIPSFFDVNSGGGEALRAMAGAKGATQAAKTVYNHVVHLRNGLGVIGFMGANGINPFVKDGQQPLRTLANDVFNGGDAALDENYNELLRLGIVDTNTLVNQYRELLSISFENNPTDFINRKIMSPESSLRKLVEPVVPSPKVRNFVPNVYRATDDYGKMSAYAYELAQLKRAYPNEAVDVLKQEAAEIVKNTFPNYARVPKGVKQLRYLPVGAFTGFASESIRTSVHIVKRGIQEIKSDNPIIKKRGRQRLVGFMTAGGIGFTGASTGSMYLMGWDKEDAQAWNILAEGKHGQDANRVWSYNSDGIPQYVDTRPVDAFSVIRDPLVIAANRALIGDFEGEELDAYIADATLRATLNFISPYVGPSIIGDVLTDFGVAMTSEDGADIKGKVLFKQKMDASDKALVVADALYKTIEPGAIPNLKKLDEALREVENPYLGKPRDKTVELVANFLGFRNQLMDQNMVDRRLEEAVERYKEKSKANYTDGLNLESEIEPAMEDYLQVQRVERNLQQDLYTVVAAYSHIHDKDSEYKHEKTITLLEKYGLPRNLRNRLVFGQFTPHDIYQVFSEGQDRVEIARDFPDQEEYYNAYNKINYYLQQEMLTDFVPEAFELETYNIEPSRQSKAKGGEVLNVPNASVEPDQRIDKMTGMPYDQQAGTAFVDEEDPLRRLGFVGGGEVDPLRRLGFGKGGGPKGKRIVGETEDYYLTNYGSGSIPKEDDSKVLKALLSNRHD